MVAKSTVMLFLVLVWLSGTSKDKYGKALCRHLAVLSLCVVVCGVWSMVVFMTFYVLLSYVSTCTAFARLIFLSQDRQKSFYFVPELAPRTTVNSRHEGTKVTATTKGQSKRQVEY